MDAHTTFSRGLAAVLALIVSLAALPAFGGTDQARKYFRQAKKAYSNGEYDEAAELLKKAYDEEANLIYQYNRIRALQGAEKYEKALEVLETYEKPMLEAKGFEDVPKIKEELEAQVDDPSEAPEPDDPGDVKDPKPKDDEEEQEEAGPEVLPWVLIGGGGAVATTGVLFATGALLPQPVRERVQEAKAQGKDQVAFPDTQKGRQQKQTLTTHRTVSYVMIPAGVLTAGAGAFLLIRSAMGGGDSESAASKLRVRPALGPDRVGAQLEFAF